MSARQSALKVEAQEVDGYERKRTGSRVLAKTRGPAVCFSEYDIPSRAARRANCLTTALLKSSYGRDWVGSSRSASGEDGNNSRLSERCEHPTNRLVMGARRRSATHYLPSSIRAKDPSVFARLGISVARAVRPQSHPRSSRGHMELSDDSRR